MKQIDVEILLLDHFEHYKRHRIVYRHAQRVS